MARQRISSTPKKKIVGNAQRKETTIQQAYSMFAINQKEKGNSKPTLAFYDRSYKKLALITEDGTQLVNVITEIGFQKRFIESLGNVNQQTINAYLRGFRSFGNYCENIGLIKAFNCPIKEIDPPLKQVYTNAELKILTRKPDIDDFVAFRDYNIIVLLLSTGARTNTILNLHIFDVDLDEGYIIFNTTKAKKVVRVGLERKAQRDLGEYISYWRSGEGIRPDDYLFCNSYGEKLSRSGLSKTIASYNRSRGVDKTSIHLFRHTFAKNWITSGGDLISLARVLTHSELEMVKRYSNLYGSDIKAEIEEHSTMSQLKTQSGQTIKTKKRK